MIELRYRAVIIIPQSSQVRHEYHMNKKIDDAIHNAKQCGIELEYKSFVETLQCDVIEGFVIYFTITNEQEIYQ